MVVAELKNISKHYTQSSGENRQRVLDDLSLTIAERETIAVTGPSGSGKTTLLNILGTLDRPDAGTVNLNGLPAGTLNDNELAALRNRYIGFVFQLHRLLPQLTAMENVLLPLLPVRNRELRAHAESRAVSLLEKVGLKEHLKKYPAELSVGECQRLAVIRALINQPKLLLADEPTGSLDANNAAVLTDLLATLQTELGFSMVLVTHDPEVASKMHKNYRLLNGKLTETTRDVTIRP